MPSSPISPRLTNQVPAPQLRQMEQLNATLAEALRRVHDLEAKAAQNSLAPRPPVAADGGPRSQVCVIC